MRSGFGDGLAQLGRSHPNVVALCTDLISSVKMDEFANEKPERFFQIGIAEANMMCIVARLTIRRINSFYRNFCQFLHWAGI